MPQFSVGGRETSLDEAVAEAARLLGASRLPVIAGLGTDVIGIRAAVRLADRCGAVIDHMHSGAVLRDLDVLREHGMLLTTPNEARRRADTVLLVGPGLEAAGLSRVLPDLGTPGLDPLADAQPGQKFIRLCTGASDERLGGEPADALGVVRAGVHGRWSGSGAFPRDEVDAVVGMLRDAKFGVAVWSPAHLDGLAIEMLCGLVKDLNAATRWSGLPLGPADGAADAVQTCGWMTGFPMRTSFARGYPEHDPWQFDAQRLLAGGGADCVIWISDASGEAPHPAWDAEIPMISLTGAEGAAAQGSRVQIRVGRAGVDHDGVAVDPRLGTFVPIAATKASDLPSVAMVLERIASSLGEGGAAC